MSKLPVPPQVAPIAYIAWRDGKPCYEGDDAVCEDAVWPVDFDDDRTSMPVYLHPAPYPTEGVITINGKRYAVELFGTNGFMSAPGTILRIEEGPDDVVTCTTLQPAAVPAPLPPHECKTEAEKVAYCAGWWKALEANRK
jgi:hypothetical protein